MDLNRQATFGIKKRIITEESDSGTQQIFQTTGFSKTPNSKPASSNKGLSIEIPGSPKFEEGSENNPEFGLPDVSDEVNMPVKTVGGAKTCTFGPGHSKNKSTMGRRSAFFGAPASAPDLSSNVSSSEASLPKISPLNILAENSE